jgi:hypothetical protein
MWNPGSIPFRRQSYNLNLAGLRRGLASPFAGLGRLLCTLAAALLPSPLPAGLRATKSRGGIKSPPTPPPWPILTRFNPLTEVSQEYRPQKEISYDCVP